MEPTTRAYTVRLTGDDEGDWRKQLWSTHVTANHAVKVWGEWLLTLRGGLPASLIDDPELLPVKEKDIDDAVEAAQEANPEAEIDESVIQHELELTRQNRLRVVLAISWLSVEAGQAGDVPNQFIVAMAGDPVQHRTAATLLRFEEILRQKGVPEADQNAWIEACRPTLSSRIRDEACWVDRASAFNRFSEEFNGQLNTEWASKTFFDLIGGRAEYFAGVNLDASASGDGKDFVIKAGNWLSANWGSGTKSDADAIAEKLKRLANVSPVGVGEAGSIAIGVMLAAIGVEVDSTLAADLQMKKLKQAVGWKGRPSKGAMALQKLADTTTVDTTIWDAIRVKLLEEASEQSAKSATGGERPDWMDSLRDYLQHRLHFPYRTTKDLIWEHAVLLDHALRRVSVAHTWIKRAEAERQRFASDAAQLQAIDPTVVAWLDAYCEIRSADSGAEVAYQIRKSAIDGWDQVVKAWSAPACRTKLLRVEAVHDIQRGLDGDDKWGDSRLFEDLAADDTVAVCQDAAGRFSIEPLKKYVAAATARSNRLRFKVPAYRHPNAFMNPVWVDFGNSRWSITWSALEAVNETRKLKTKLASAKTDAAKQKFNSQLQQNSELQAVTLGLWTGHAVEDIRLRWQGNRLRNDLDLDHFGNDGVAVTRADRVSRAAADAGSNAVTVKAIFDQKDWNGRLQLNRAALERLHHYLAKNSCSLVDMRQWDDKAQGMWNGLRWFLTTSAKLMPSGPFLDLVSQGLPEGWSWNEKRACLNYEPNKAQKRSGRSRIQLARIPGLRVLSLDLGHRYAAACAVWETLTREQMNEVCIRAGQPVPAESSMFQMVKGKTTGPVRKAHGTKKQPKERTTVYRRIGPDVLPDGTRHPAPWARLDRQFLIRLQGEDGLVRSATQEEFDGYNRFREFAGLKKVTAEEVLDVGGVWLKTPAITRLVDQALRDARYALRRFSDRARIAYAMTTTQKPISGARMQVLGESERTAYIQDALLWWHQLATSREFVSSNARQWWGQWIVGRLNGPSLVELPEEMSRPARKTSEHTIQQSLHAVAKQLADPECQLAIRLKELWTSDWEQQRAEWQVQLRWLRRLVMPRIGKKPSEGNFEELKAWTRAKLAIRGMGGLSYPRLRAFRSLYEVLKAFKMRAEPDDIRKNVPLPGSRDLGCFGRRILDQFEKLRTQRIKQLASRVVEAALGVGAEPGRDQKRMRKRSSDPRFRPCHAVIVENLKNYRPEESRLRRENKRLADWSAANVRKYIEEGCQLHGLYFDHVPADYTSKQDSRTGLPGVRCEDVSRRVFADAAKGTANEQSSEAVFDKHSKSLSRWRREIQRSESRMKEGKADERDKLIGAIADKIRNPSTEGSMPDLLIVPCRGGELFLGSESKSEADIKRPSTLQADLNAAANIGIVALLDPDFTGAWWRIKVSPSTGATAKADYPGSPLFESPMPLLNESQRGGKRDRQNAFSRTNAGPLADRQWSNQWEFWPGVLEQCCARLREWYDLE